MQSQPLPAVIAEMLTNSDNNTAEMMLKEIGLAASGAGTRQAGADAIVATLAGCRGSTRTGSSSPTAVASVPTTGSRAER